MKKYRCVICGYIYDEAKEEVKFDDLPDDWVCPLCGSPKSAFEEVKEEYTEKEIEEKDEVEENDELRSLTNEEITYICSNLAKACEKEYKEEQNLFLELATYFEEKNSDEPASIEELKKNNGKEKNEIDQAMQIADKNSDRGAKRVLTWATKTSNMMKIILENYEKKGLEYIKNTKIWVCDICGFIYIGEEPPKICPVCKVPSFKILEVK